MIIKSYEIQKNPSNFLKYNLFLLYGENNGLKKDIKESIKVALNKKDGRSLLLGAKSKKGLYTVKVDDIEYEANKASAKICPMKIIRINKLNK